jgi:hypothetical protein
MADASWLTHYPITLPRDYDMSVIRERVRSVGSTLDGREGLLFKAYAIREHDVDGSPLNQYARFYAWSSASAAADFLVGGGGFQHIIASFGRPQVHSWMPVATGSGQLIGPDVQHAVQWSRQLTESDDPIEVTDQLAEDVRSIAGAPAVHAAVAGINPTNWQATIFVTSSGSVELPQRLFDAGGIGFRRFEVLHVSEGQR